MALLYECEVRRGVGGDEADRDARLSSARGTPDAVGVVVG